MPTFEATSFGGGNWNDPPETLLLRSHQPDPLGNFRQIGPLEASDTQNADLFDRAVGSRRGSALLVDLGAAGENVLVSSEVLIDGIEFNGSSYVVGKKSIYTNQSDSWAQINDSASAAYAHAADVTKCSFAEVDGHLFIGLDGANKIQAYRAGADLDDEMDNANTYEETFGGGTQSITGTWGTGYYLVMAFNSRLLFANGDFVVEYSDVFQPWDRTGGGFDVFGSNLIAMSVFVPYGGNEFNQLGFFFCENGPWMRSGFDATDVPYKAHGIGAPLSYRSVVITPGWIMWLTRERTIQATNGVRAVELGRRFLNGDGITGPLDTVTPTNIAHGANTFGFYDEKRKQTPWFFPDESSTMSSHAIVLDFQLDTQQTADEPVVRPLVWTIKDPGTNPWFIGMYQATGTVHGITADGKIWQHNTGKNDLGTLPVEGRWDSPELTMGVPDQNKSYRRMALRSKQVGPWPLFIDLAKNRDTEFINSFSYQQVQSGAALYDVAEYDVDSYVEGGSVRGARDLQKYSESLRFRLRNDNADEDFLVQAITLDFSLGHRAA